jgi:hypothetical protein
VHRLLRWPAAGTRGSIPLFVAAATALAMVGALIPDSGILARAPDGTQARNVSAQGAAALVLNAPVGTLGIAQIDPAIRSGVQASLAALPVVPPLQPPGELHLVLPLQPPKEPSTGAQRGGAVTATGHRTSWATSWQVAPIVTWYGPGFYGRRTACGQRYSRTIIGVASRTLPCGTLVQFRWNGITAVAPVIDRGPYASADIVFDWSARLACHVFKPRGVANACFTRHEVAWRVIGRRRK